MNAKRDDIPGRVREAKAFFVDSLEEWGEKMTLVGHSLGAYMSVAYALGHPTGVSRLVLLSLAGVPRDPNTTVPSREVTDDRTDQADFVSVDDAMWYGPILVGRCASRRFSGFTEGEVREMHDYILKSPSRMGLESIVFVGGFPRYWGVPGTDDRRQHIYWLQELTPGCHSWVGWQRSRYP